jgi:hypothetical protein
MTLGKCTEFIYFKRKKKRSGDFNCSRNEFRTQNAYERFLLISEL